MKKIQKSIKNKDLINIFKKSKIKNYINKKHIVNFSYLLTKFKKNIKIVDIKLFGTNVFFQKYFITKKTNFIYINNIVKLSIFLL